MLHAAIVWVCVSLLVLVPLVFTTAVYRVFVLPKLAVLLLGSSVIVLLTACLAAGAHAGDLWRPLKSPHALLVGLYAVIASLYTLGGVTPIGAFFGTDAIQMGLVTLLCFVAFFGGLLIAVGSSRERLVVVLWAVSFAGLIAASYAFAQFFGRDPFLDTSLYTYRSPSGAVVRVPGPLGHSNYLGNFLLYTTGLTAGLALASRGRAFRIAIVAVALSIVAIVFSGTRGAWVGIVVTAVTFAALELRRRSASDAWWNRRRAFGVAAAGAIILVAGLIIVSNPATRMVGVRARSFVTDKFTGAGRTLLWRDAVRMVPAYAFIGCGPEGFNRAFLAYKSEELARFSPVINNESSHNSYLDAAISYGLPGAALYVAIISSSFALLLKSRRRAATRELRFVITGLVSSLSGVVVHNFFIYDQVPTGFYFFAFMSIALAVSRVTTSEQAPQDGGAARREAGRSSLRAWTGRSAVVAAFALFVATGWYVIGEVRADMAIKRAFASARAGRFDEMVRDGQRATRSLNPTRAYDFLFARALAVFVERTKGAVHETGEAREQRRKAIEMGIVLAEGSVTHSLTPESNYLLAGYLSLDSGDFERVRAYASEAIRLDANYASGHRLMAEVHLAAGDREAAAREAGIALRLRPNWSEAQLVLAQADRRKLYGDARVEDLMHRARALADAGKPNDAERLLLRAIRISSQPCPDCHQILAQVYEKLGRTDKAINEWRTYSSLAGSDAARVEASARVERLQQKTGSSDSTRRPNAR